MSTSDPRSTANVAESVASITDEIAELLDTHGREAGDYTVLGPDPWQVIFNNDRSGFINFLEARRCLVSWRSPVARPEDQPELLARLALRAEQLRKPLFAVAVNETMHSAGLELGMTSIWTGSEVYLELAKWSTLGGRRQKVRWAKSHAAKLGLIWREAFPLSDPQDQVGLQFAEDEWRLDRPVRANDSFLRTAFMEIGERRRYFACDGPQGIVAFVACSPISAKGWYLQDVVRTSAAPRGALEGAMAFALDTFRDEGFEIVSNGALPFWRPHAAWTAPDQLGVVGNQILRYLDRQYRFQGINQFRSKFEPDWTIPLYILRTQKMITPLVARSLVKLLKTRRRTRRELLRRMAARR